MLGPMAPVELPPPPEAPARAASAPASIGDAPAGYRMLDVDRIVPSPFQPRRAMDEAAVGGLAESIKRSGLMQPVVVREVAGRFELVAGERRWRAARMAGLTSIPASVRRLSDEEAAECALAENVQREDLNPMDRAAALRRLCDGFGVAHGEIAARLGMDRTTVTNLIRLTELEPEVGSLIASGALSAGHGRACLIAPPGPSRVQLARDASEKHWSVRRVEAEARRLAGAAGAHKAHARRAVAEGEAMHGRLAVVRDMERRIAQALGTKVAISTDRTGTKGTIAIEFFGLDHFDGLMARLGVETR